MWIRLSAHSAAERSKGCTKENFTAGIQVEGAAAAVPAAAAAISFAVN